jgi:hypothetical protein
MEWKKIEGGAQTDRMWNGKDSSLSVNDTIEGKYIDKADNVGDNNSNIYVIEESNATKTGVWGTNVLDRKMDRLKVGDTVKIVYLGKKPGKSGRTYHDFDVYVGQGIESNMQF